MCQSETETGDVREMGRWFMSFHRRRGILEEFSRLSRHCLVNVKLMDLKRTLKCLVWARFRLFQRIDSEANCANSSFFRRNFVCTLITFSADFSLFLLRFRNQKTLISKVRTSNSTSRLLWQWFTDENKLFVCALQWPIEDEGLEKTSRVEVLKKGFGGKCLGLEFL